MKWKDDSGITSQEVKDEKGTQRANQDFNVGGRKDTLRNTTPSFSLTE